MGKEIKVDDKRLLLSNPPITVDGSGKKLNQKDYIEVKLLGWIVLTIIGVTAGAIAGLWLFSKTI